ncbi:helix-turn-helix domain-containing protein [Rhizobium lusitanum]|uniref:DnaA protein helix-turn-helix n=1 Tax=Rhizobium lusitanum TaxID=293958 RepID=A0A1C3VRL2_9HYPH|nr:dnaA protein helix-turn-helix [Rhizobium lusitanum]
MNIHVEINRYRSEAEIHLEAKARRKRFEIAGRRALVMKAAALPAPVTEKPFIAQKAPMWELRPVEFDAHVREWNWRAANPAHAYLKDRCIEIGMAYSKVVGGRVLHEIVAVRHQLIWEIYDKFPLSLPQIGRMFGGRDHTSILYAVRKVEAKMKIEEEAVVKMVAEALR